MSSRNRHSNFFNFNCKQFFNNLILPQCFIIQYKVEEERTVNQFFKSYIFKVIVFLLNPTAGVSVEVWDTHKHTLFLKKKNTANIQNLVIQALPHVKVKLLNNYGTDSVMNILIILFKFMLWFRSLKNKMGGRLRKKLINLFLSKSSFGRDLIKEHKNPQGWDSPFLPNNSSKYCFILIFLEILAFKDDILKIFSWQSLKTSLPTFNEPGFLVAFF